MSPGSELAWLNSHRWYAEGNGIHWKKYEKESDRLASMGITACWIPRTSYYLKILTDIMMSSANKRVQHVSSYTYFPLALLKMVTGTVQDTICKVPSARSCVPTILTALISYDIWDLGEFDQKGAKRTKWGTKEDLLQAIKVAADKGIITYIDAVLNHKYVLRHPQPIRVI